jgi:hypothetical protein
LQTNPTRTTALHSCCTAAFPDVCAALLACGADPTLRDADGLKSVELAIETVRRPDCRTTLAHCVRMSLCVSELV